MSKRTMIVHVALEFMDLGSLADLKKLVQTYFMVIGNHGFSWLLAYWCLVVDDNHGLVGNFRESTG
jgi:hypothetical protein